MNVKEAKFDDIVMFFKFFSIQTTTAYSDGSLQHHHPHIGSGEHHLSLQASGVPEPGGSATLRCHYQVHFHLTNSLVNFCQENIFIFLPSALLNYPDVYHIFMEIKILNLSLNENNSM